MAVYYLGAFPPPRGGVTIKNQRLYQALSEKMRIDRVDFSIIKQKKIHEMLTLFRVLVHPENRFVIGIAGKKTRKRFSKVMYWLNRAAMQRSIIMMMGGTVSGDIAQDQRYRMYVKEYRQIYVETDGMRETLEAVGLNNVSVFPNGRFRPKKKIEPIEHNGRLRCVFFSRIHQEKGADIVLEAAKYLHNVDFAFYGEIEPAYKAVFDMQLSRLDNVVYRGVFSGSDDDVYGELSNYDVLLLPTKWASEGVPGILVEAKIAGLVPIVSANNYNAELVKHGVEGIVLSENCVEDLVREVSQLDFNRERLLALKKGSAHSAEKYYIDNYIMDILGMMSD